jgi:predicted transcriptional regulator
MDEKQQLLAELARIQSRIDAIKAQEKVAVQEELESLATQINKLIDEGKEKAARAGLFFEYAQGYERFGVYQWEQSDYC